MFLLLISVMVVTIIPLFFPFLVWFIGTLLHNNFDPFLLVSISILWSFIMWFVRYYSNEKIFNLISKKLGLQDKKKPALMIKIEWYLNNSKISYILWIVIAIAAWSGFPDILTVRIVHKKVNIYQWISAYMVGKTFLYVPLIYGGDIILKWIANR